jgi:hypothetical protein
MDDRELLWRQYQQNVDLYRFYLELVLKINIFYYGITGAIISFYFTHPATEGIQFSLVLPLVMSVVLTALFLYGAVLLNVTRSETFALRDALKLQVAPEMRVLQVLLISFAVVFVVVAAGLIHLLCSWK